MLSSEDLYVNIMIQAYDIWGYTTTLIGVKRRIIRISCMCIWAGIDDYHGSIAIVYSENATSQHKPTKHKHSWRSLPLPQRIQLPSISSVSYQNLSKGSNRENSLEGFQHLQAWPSPRMALFPSKSRTDSKFLSSYSSKFL